MKYFTTNLFQFTKPWLKKMHIYATIYSLHKIPKSHLISWCENFVETVSAEFWVNSTKLCVSAKLPRQEIRWNFGILRSAARQFQAQQIITFYLKFKYFGNKLIETFLYLTHFSRIFDFYSPFVFLTFSRGIEMKHWAKMRWMKHQTGNISLFLL